MKKAKKMNFKKISTNMKVLEEELEDKRMDF